jgi:hypothetical protein
MHRGKVPTSIKVSSMQLLMTLSTSKIESVILCVVLCLELPTEDVRTPLDRWRWNRAHGTLSNLQKHTCDED